MTVLLAMIFRFVRRSTTTRLQVLAFGIVMGYVCFLSAVMVFAADPMKPSIVAARDGAGLSPLLQHPAMMIHPPIIFAGYAAWTMPCALALSAHLGPVRSVVVGRGTTVGDPGLGRARNGRLVGRRLGV